MEDDTKFLTKLLIIAASAFVIIVGGTLLGKFGVKMALPETCVKVVDKREETTGSLFGFGTEYNVVFEDINGNRRTCCVSEQDYGKFDVGCLYLVKFFGDECDFVSRADEWQ